jgi:hypothetical protein
MKVRSTANLEIYNGGFEGARDQEIVTFSKELNHF